MRILGIETSCDETAAAVLDIRGDKVKILSNVVSSQVKIHRKYGGVVPEVAARKHAEVIFEVIGKALISCQRDALTKLSKHPFDAIDLIAVTQGPGLVTSLRVGVLAAQALAALSKKPLVGVNHIEAHLFSPFLSCHCEPEGRGNPGEIASSSRKIGTPRKDIVFPTLGLIVSGGHTELVLVKNFCKYEMIGSTRDDAVGEAFDKVAKMLGLSYPGGPTVSREAAKFHIPHSTSHIPKLPRPMLNSNDFDFSFAGLKTAVLYLTKKMTLRELKKATPAICAEFQKAAIEVLAYKTKRAAEKYRVKSILVGGGVSANRELRAALQKLDYPVFLPELQYTGDNAAMIAYAGYKKYQREKKNEVFSVAAEPNLVI